jgi:serine/threonine-protein kinase HipA
MRPQIDPTLRSLQGPQYAGEGKDNFGAFLDSSPDRWGRVLMQRREAQLAREAKRPARVLAELDYLLGVFDGHRMGGLRFRYEGGPFLDDNTELASPPWTSLRELEEASPHLERVGAEADPAYGKWLRMLIAPGRSLGGARPKASVVDPKGQLWIAKFPSAGDIDDIGAWESVAHALAKRAGVTTPDVRHQRFGKRHHTFLARRFDRAGKARIHFASAMTLLDRRDGDVASYLDLADAIVRHGARAGRDLEQLWRRIVFFVSISNVDDHLRNHGFLLEDNGWSLAPAYDINPVATGGGLTLNISETDNAQDLDLVRDVAKHFRIKPPRAGEIIDEVLSAVANWRIEAKKAKLSRGEQDRMAPAFALADR